MQLSSGIVNFYLFYDRHDRPLTRSKSRISVIQVTIKSCGLLVLGWTLMVWLPHILWWESQQFLAHLSWELKTAFLIACCLSSVHLSQGEIIRKLQKFIEEILKSFSEPLGQFQPNLAQSILGWWGFKISQRKGHALFQGEIITKCEKYIDKI